MPYECVFCLLLLPLSLTAHAPLTPGAGGVKRQVDMWGMKFYICKDIRVKTDVVLI